ncbi:hypothetical protein [Streptomyces sp. NRRL S-87]|uniref:hypothetical protein n=1 Tax=Streptomyces sp. NRRL S-87 TaxID=1463920 RepID=UPI00068A1E9F|nr:hypothetical protein [Streptomyces sp. NRRL S-87]
MTAHATAEASTLALVESPVQLLNVLEWAHAESRARAAARQGERSPLPGVPPQPAGGSTRRAAPLPGLRVVVLPPVDPMSRGQLRRMAALARDEGHTVQWQEARGGALAPFRALGSLRGAVRRAERLVVGDPFSRFVQLLLTSVRARELVVVDDGTATMEFVGQIARGERLVRWHRVGAQGLPGKVKELAYAPVSAQARRRFTPGRSGRRRVTVFSAMPVTAPEGVELVANEFAWTRSAFGPPRLCAGTDLVGTSLVETGVVAHERYVEAVRRLAAVHGATRYFAHRREGAEKLRALSEATGLEIVRPDLPLELIARRGPIGRTIVSFPSTVVHTLPYALAGTGVTVAVCDIDPGWLAGAASPRAQSFLAGVTDTARDVRRLATTGGASTSAAAG